MTVNTIVRCVCTKGKRDGRGSKQFGMPVLLVAPVSPHRQEWSAKCPACGRGYHQFGNISPYKALVEWNNAQRGLWVANESGADFDRIYAKDEQIGRDRK